jgi:hypothetical protein
MTGGYKVGKVYFEWQRVSETGHIFTIISRTAFEKRQQQLGDQAVIITRSYSQDREAFIISDSVLAEDVLKNIDDAMEGPPSGYIQAPVDPAKSHFDYLDEINKDSDGS